MNDPYFKNFIKTKNLSESSERVYIGRLRAFCEFIEKNPSELIKRSSIWEIRKIDKYFHEYIENLKNNGKYLILSSTDWTQLKPFIMIMISIQWQLIV